MRERRGGIQELEANLGACLEKVRSGTTLLVTDGGHRVARLIPEPGASESKNGPAIAWSRRRLRKMKPNCFYRVRKHPRVPSDASECDSPPPSQSDGRLDADTGSVMYGSTDVDTCLHECRVSAEDDLFVATLRPKRQLKLLVEVDGGRIGGRRGYGTSFPGLPSRATQEDRDNG